MPSKDPEHAPLLLVAEDHRVNRVLIDRVLRALGYRTVLVENGREAVEAVRAALQPAGAPPATPRDAFDGVLLDLEMPVMGGLEAASTIRAFGGQASLLPILAITAHSPGEFEKDALKHGFDGFVNKPISAADLAATLRRFIRRD